MIRVAFLSICMRCLVDCADNTGNMPAAPLSLSHFSEGGLVLFRLDGDRHPEEASSDGAKLLHDREILRSIQIATPRDRATIFMAFEDGEEGARRNPIIPADCFRPRHAIRITARGTTTDHLICFVCQNFMTWTNGEMTGGGSTSDRPQAVFESYLGAATSDH